MACVSRYQKTLTPYCYWFYVVSLINYTVLFVHLLDIIIFSTTFVQVIFSLHCPLHIPLVLPILVLSGNMSVLISIYCAVIP